MMALTYDTFYVGQQIEPLVKPPVTKVQLVKYAGASGDFNPLHTDDAFAQSIGMDGVIAHGMLIMGFLGEYVMKIAGNDAVVERFSMRFGAMTVPQDTITCKATVSNVSDNHHTVELTLTAEKAPTQIVGSGKAVLNFEKTFKE